MKTRDPYAPATVWDSCHTAGDELNPREWWAPGLLPFLNAAGARTVLDVGCGTGGTRCAWRRTVSTSRPWTTRRSPSLAHERKPPAPRSNSAGRYGSAFPFHR